MPRCTSMTEHFHRIFTVLKNTKSATPFLVNMMHPAAKRWTVRTYGSTGID